MDITEIFLKGREIFDPIKFVDTPLLLSAKGVLGYRNTGFSKIEKSRIIPWYVSRSFKLPI